MYDSIPCRPETESKHVIRNHQPDEIRIAVHERPRRLWHVPMPLSKIDQLLKSVRLKFNVSKATEPRVTESRH